MDKVEAEALLKAHLEGYLEKPLWQLKRLLDESDRIELQADSGVVYQIEVFAVWDDEEQRHLRLLGSIDDGSFLRAMHPLTMSFLLD